MWIWGTTRFPMFVEIPPQRKEWRLFLFDTQTTSTFIHCPASIIKNCLIRCVRVRYCPWLLNTEIKASFVGLVRCAKMLNNYALRSDFRCSAWEHFTFIRLDNNGVCWASAVPTIQQVIVLLNEPSFWLSSSFVQSPPVFAKINHLRSRAKNSHD